MKSRRFSSDRQLLDIEANKIVVKNGGKGTGVGNVQAFLHLVGNRLPKSIKQGQLRIRLQRVDLFNAQAPFDYVLQIWV